MRYLELLAPARTADIGIAAIDCGADAVYIAGPGFGARKDATNDIVDIKRLCDYAHKFGARVFVTVNTIIYDEELEEVHTMMLTIQNAGADAFIVQDLSLLSFEDISIPLHASTQCAVRDIEEAVFHQNLGFSRIVLERQLSLDKIKEISKSTDCEIECFVHGALCVSYSGNCYLSENIGGRSANRGECIQACRSLYNLEDNNGRILVKNKALLSLKDFNLSDRMEDLAEAGAVSFKIEGRLKNISYVKNTVRAYSLALDSLVAAHPEKYGRVSFGKVLGGFIPDLNRTFNRGYTSLFLDGKRGQWSSMEAPKSMGEFIGTVEKVAPSGKYNQTITISIPNVGISLKNGDGFSFVSGSSIIGFRGDICQGKIIECKRIPEMTRGVKLYRNSDSAFERLLESNPCRREIGVSVSVRIKGNFVIEASATTEDGRKISITFEAGDKVASNSERMISLFTNQISKRAGHYDLSLDHLFVETDNGELPFVSASFLNGIRREIAASLDTLKFNCKEMKRGIPSGKVSTAKDISYKNNISNAVALEIMKSCGAAGEEQAYELTHKRGAELMRSRYCIKFELGMCPLKQGGSEKGPLFLSNNGRKLVLNFDCRNCEMTVREYSST